MAAEAEQQQQEPATRPTSTSGGGSFVAAALSSSIRMLRGGSGASGANRLSGSRRRTVSFTARNEGVPAFASEGLHAGGKKLKVLVCTANIGNEMPVELDSWIPFGGGKQDVVVVGMQESTFKPKANFDEADAEAAALLGDSDEDDDDSDSEDDEGPYDERQQSPFVRDESVDQDIDLASLSGYMPLSPRAIAQQTAGADGDGAAYLKKLIANHLGPQYFLVKSVRRLQMRLRVYVHRALRPDVRDLSHSAENTGLMGVVANKGGLAIALRVKGTSLCFVSCHLAAHEGEKYLRKRNENLQEIIAGAHVGPQRSLDLDVQFDHCFWLGDLNYRLDCSMSPALKDKPWAEQRAAVLEMIAKEDWAGLYALDELQRELSAGNALNGFVTPVPTFPPTFKVLRHRPQHIEYNAKRLPSYCDRVCHKSLPGLADRLAVTHYDWCPDFNTSDHKPVRAAYEINPAPDLYTEGLVIHEQPEAEEAAEEEAASPPLGGRGASLREVGGRHPKLVFYDLSASDLPIMDVGVEAALPLAVAPDDAKQRKEGKKKKRPGEEGACDPYLTFSTLPPDFTLNHKACAKTSVVTKSLAPDWGAEEVALLPAIRKDAGPEAYAALHVLITAMDFDLTSADDLIGFALIPIAPLLAASASSTAGSQPQPFELPLQKNGLAKGRGRVRGKMRIEWPGDGEVFRETRRKRMPKAAQLAAACCAVS